ncbi:MAG: hypothetical protein ACI9OJ_003353, partial [Myxococcota bacterium]
MISALTVLVLMAPPNEGIFDAESRENLSFSGRFWVDVLGPP